MQEKENISAEREFIDTKQLAKRWNKSYKTIESWRATGRGPSYYKLGNRILYDLNEIKNQIMSNLKGSVMSTVSVSLS